jgi:hypothetical protein
VDVTDNKKAPDAEEVFDRLQREAASAEWETPVGLDETNPLPAFPAEVLPGWLADYVEAVAESTQVPLDLPGMLVLGALAAAAGGRAIVEARPGWIEPTNLFGAVALAPGNRKSAVYALVTEPLRTAERDEIDRMAETIVEARTQKTIAQGKARDAARAASKAAGVEDEDIDKAGPFKPLVEALNAREDKPTPDEAKKLEAEAIGAALMAEAITVPAQPRLLADDSTPEALASLMAEHHGRIAVMSAEGGVFDTIAGKYSRFPNFDVYLKGHAGDDLRVDRKGRPPEFIERPALTVVLAIQPAVLRTIAEREGFHGRGLLARFLFVLPDSYVGRRRIGTEAVPPAIKQRYDDKLRALVLSLAEWTDPAVIPFTAAANEHLLAFEADLEPHLGPGGELHHVADWGSKLAGAVVRIAGLLHLAENLTTGWGAPISAHTFDAAATIGTYLRAHAVAVHAYMGADPVIENARAVLRWIAEQDTKVFTKRDCHRAMQARFRKSADLDGPLALLEDRGWIRRQERSDPTPGGGRPRSPVYEIHPEILDTAK